MTLYSRIASLTTSQTKNRDSIGYQVSKISSFGARYIRVFGSVARREERPDSDVDFLVGMPRGYDLFTQRLPLAERLAELLQRNVELVPEHELSRHIRDRVLQEAVEL